MKHSWFAAAALAAVTVVGGAWADNDPPFKLGTNVLEHGKPFDVKYTFEQKSPSSDREWVTIVAVGKPDSEYGTWKYVDDKAKSTTLVAPSAPGKYEVRLHTHYPAKSFNVVYREAVTVK